MKPQHSPWLMPYITCADIAAARDFYVNAFGFSIQEQMKNDQGQLEYVELKYHEATLMLGQQGAFGDTRLSPKTSGLESPIGLYLYTENVDQFYQHALEHGGHGIQAPIDMFWGDRICRIKDNEEYIWVFASTLK